MPEITTTPGRWSIDLGYRSTRFSRIFITIVTAAEFVNLIQSVQAFAGGHVSMAPIVIEAVIVAVVVVAFLMVLRRKRWTRRSFRRDPAVQAAADRAVAAYAAALDRAADLRSRGLHADDELATKELARSVPIAMDMHRPPRWVGPELQELLPAEARPALEALAGRLDAMFPVHLLRTPGA